MQLVARFFAALVLLAVFIALFSVGFVIIAVAVGVLTIATLYLAVKQRLMAAKYGEAQQEPPLAEPTVIEGEYREITEEEKQD